MKSQVMKSQVMKSPKPWVSAAIGFAILLASSSCSKRHEGASGAGNPRIPVAPLLMTRVCETITRCHSVSAETCATGMQNTSGFSAVLGLSSNYDTYSAILQAEQSGVLVGNNAIASSCSNQMSSLSCTDASVQAAYDPLAANPFSGAPGLFSNPTCSQSFAPKSYKTVIIADSPLVYLQLGETTGAVATDVMGAHDGTITLGAGLSQGVPGAIVGSSDGAVSFTHLGAGRIDLSLPTINTTPGTDVSVEFWMKWSGDPSDMMPFGFQSYSLLLWNSLSPNNAFGFNTGNGDLFGIQGSPVLAFANRWVHVVAVLRNAATPSDISSSKLYIDSATQVSSQTATPLAATASSALRISSWPQSTSYLFDGSIDEFAVYNFALTPHQIAQHYQAGLGNP
jgi:hypothetical protein